MSDWREPIPQLLRAHRERVHDLSGVGYVCPSICEIAADEIERLRLALSTVREEAEAAKAEAGSVRMCVNCGKTVPASHPRNEPLEECTGPDGLAACTFDTTPHEAWQVWRDRYCELEREFSTAREEGRLEGLGQAEAAVRSLSCSSKIISGVNSALAAILALKEKQP